MNQDLSTTRPPVIPIFILFGSFTLLLLVLITRNNTPNLQITPQNVHLLRETLGLESGLAGNGSPPRQFALSADNNTLLVTSSSANEIWHLDTGTKQVMSLLNAGGYTPLVYFDNKEPLAVFDNWSGSYSFLNLYTGQTLQRFDGLYPGATYSDWNISPDGQWFAFSRGESVLSLANIKTDEVRFEAYPPKGFMFRRINPTFSDDGKLLATSLIQNSPFAVGIAVWDAVTGELVRHLGYFAIGTSIVDSFAFSHDGKWLAVGGGVYTDDDNRSVIQLWELATGAKLGTLSHEGLSVQRLIFTPDNKRLLATGYGDLWLWDILEALNTGTPSLHLAGDGTGTDYEIAALSHDGQLLAVTTPGNKILIYDVQTVNLLRTLVGHLNRVNQLTFSADDQFLISGSDDYTIRFWSVGSKKPYPAVTNLQADSTVTAPIMTPTTPG